MGYKIIVRGEAKTSYKNLSELDGIDCQESFSEYFDSDDSYADVVTGGYMSFKFEYGRLWTETDYSSTRELTQDEFKIILNINAIPEFNET